MSDLLYNCNGGRKLTSIGASWFVSYLYYLKFDKNHLNWQKVGYDNRIRTFNKSSEYWNEWLIDIINGNDKKLKNNQIGLEPIEIKNMAKEILKLFEES